MQNNRFGYFIYSTLDVNTLKIYRNKNLILSASIIIHFRLLKNKISRYHYIGNTSQSEPRFIGTITVFT